VIDDGSGLLQLKPKHLKPGDLIWEDEKWQCVVSVQVRKITINKVERSLWVIRTSSDLIIVGFDSKKTISVAAHGK
jgi:hypothetical protein